MSPKARCDRGWEEGGAGVYVPAAAEASEQSAYMRATEGIKTKWCVFRGSLFQRPRALVRALLPCFACIPCDKDTINTHDALIKQRDISKKFLKASLCSLAPSYVRTSRGKKGSWGAKTSAKREALARECKVAVKFANF